MKLNSKIWLLGAVALGLAACSDDEYTGEPQVIPQPSVLPADAVSGTDVYAAGSTLDINAERADIDKMINLLNLTRVDQQPEGYALQVNMILAKTVADLANPKACLDTVLTVLPEQAGAVQSLGLSAKALNILFHKLYGVNDAPQSVVVRFDAYSVTEDQTSALVGTVGNGGAITFKPVQYAYTPESSYYVVNSDDSSVKYLMNHSDNSVWEDGKFTVVFKVPMGGFGWKIVPASMVSNPVSAQCFGPAPDAGDMSGALALGGDAGFIDVVQEAPYMVSVNMTNPNEDYTALQPEFTVQIAYSILYVLGNAQGGDGAPAVLTTKDYVTYGGFVAYSGWGCKMTSRPAWDGTEFANFTFEGPDAAGTYTGEVGKGSKDGNILGLPDGIYAWVYNITTGKVQATPIEYFELIGTATGGWEDDKVQKLAPATDAADCAVYTADIDFMATGEFKLRGVQPKVGNAWAYSLGGALDDLQWDGANSVFDGAIGVHKLSISFNASKDGWNSSDPDSMLHIVYDIE